MQERAVDLAAARERARPEEGRVAARLDEPAVLQRARDESFVISVEFEDWDRCRVDGKAAEDSLLMAACYLNGRVLSVAAPAPTDHGCAQGVPTFAAPPCRRVMLVIIAAPRLAGQRPALAEPCRL